MSTVNLHILFNLFKSPSAKRNEELKMVFEKNCKLDKAKMHVFVDKNVDSQTEYAVDWSKIQVVDGQELTRPTYAFWVRYMNEHIKSGHVAIINSDIEIPQKTVDSLQIPTNVAYAISRHNVDQTGKKIVPERQWRCSQDAWVFSLPLTNPFVLEKIDFELGQWGCDNRFAYEIVAAGYKLENPYATHKILHHHNQEIHMRKPTDVQIDCPYLCFLYNQQHPALKKSQSYNITENCGSCGKCKKKC